MINLLNGDCLEVLKTLESDSIDSLVTDPPAGIGFMGKEWDHHKGGRDQWIAWMSEVMRECLRVMKPGAHGLVWAIPRTSHWTATALENAGFEIRDVVTHLFGSGFPKSLDISKAIDKAAGVDREKIKRIGKQFTGSNDNIAGITGEFQVDSNIPATDAAKQWQGWGTALKPASEHWILVRKPCSEKTVAANVLKHGTGGINIDASRIETMAKPTASGLQRYREFSDSHTGQSRPKLSATIPEKQGRFPANLVLSHSHHCTDDQCDIECAIMALDAQSGISKSPKKTKAKNTTKSETVNAYGAYSSQGRVINGHGDSGGASRFFYCAKISTSERNAGLEGMPDKELARSCGAQASGSGNHTGSFNHVQTVKNHHPTVKPKKLMSYFCKMITPPNGIVLDPFMGSGSTGIAAKECGFKFIGIEKDNDYFEIAKNRINA